MDGVVGKVSALGPSGWQCGKSFGEVPFWNRIEAVSQMKTPWTEPGSDYRLIDMEGEKR